MLQRDGPEHLRGRAFARFETRFQLAWCAGALIPVALLDVLTRRSGFFLLALVLGFAGLSYVGGLRARHEWGGNPSAAERHRGGAGRAAGAGSPGKPAAGVGLARYNSSVELTFRPIVSDDLPGFLRADEYGFGYRHDYEPHLQWAGAELERTVAAFDGDEIVGTGRNYSLELTLPGGAVIPASGVSWISVRPTHRRQGILRSMMEYLLEEGARREDPVSILTASEGGIYERFGYGVANARAEHQGGPQRGRVSPHPVADGRVRLVEPEESAKLAPEVFERVRATRPGAVSRPSFWWPGEWVAKEHVKNRFDAIYELDGRVDGYAVYNIEGTWAPAGSQKSVAVHDLVAATPQAEAALWQFLCSIDLTQWVTGWNVPPDTELRWRLRDARQMQTQAYRDWLWLRPVDTAALLSARRYGVADRLVLEVRDETRPEGAAAGRYLLDGGPDGASCIPTDAAADLVLGVADLGAISLGGVSAGELARAGRIDEEEPGALAARRSDVRHRARTVLPDLVLNPEPGPLDPEPGLLNLGRGQPGPAGDRHLPYGPRVSTASVPPRLRTGDGARAEHQCGGGCAGRASSRS